MKNKKKYREINIQSKDVKETTATKNRQCGNKAPDKLK